MVRKFIVFSICLLGLATPALAWASISLVNPLISANEQSNSNEEILEVTVGDALEISWNVENSSPTTGRSSFTHYISDNTFISRFDIPLGTSSIDNTLPNTNIDKLTAIADVVPGIYYIATCQGQESKCVIAGSVNVVPKPDFLLLTPLISSAGKNNLDGQTVSIRVGRKLNISWAVENSTSAPGTTLFTHYLSSDSLISALDTNIGAAEVDNTLLLTGILTAAKMPQLPLGVYTVGTCENIEDNCKVAGTIELLEQRDALTAPLLLLLLD